MASSSVTQQRLGVGAVRIRVGRRCHECSFQVDVDLTEERMKPVIHRTHGIASIEVSIVGSRHLRYRSTRLERGHRLMLHRATVDDAGLTELDVRWRDRARSRTIFYAGKPSSNLWFPTFPRHFLYRLQRIFPNSTARLRAVWRYVVDFRRYFRSPWPRWYLAPTI